jgi:hypothetical protein
MFPDLIFDAHHAEITVVAPELEPKFDFRQELFRS